jgi:TonB family protein
VASQYARTGTEGFSNLEERDSPESGFRDGLSHEAATRMTTMTADPPRKTSLGVGFQGSRGRSASGEAWKQQIGTKPIPARFALLPEHKPNWTRVGASAIVQISILVFFILVPLLYPEGMKTALHFYTSTPIAQPITEIPVAPTPPPPAKVKAPAPKAEVKPPDPIEPPKLNPQQPHIFADLVKPKTVQPKIEKVEVKEPDLKPVFDDAKVEIKENGPKRPKDDVKLNNMTGSAAPATVVAPVEKVQTGGFGDPNGLPGKGDPNRPTNVNRQGSPALPGGEGYGNGTAGKDGIRGTVASTGFGNGTATPPSGSGKKGTVVASSGFGAMDTSTDAPKKKTGPSGPADTNPEILDKPKPEYTADARNLKIEGDVVIDLIFKANGTIQINKVVSGLGHGLDESAVRSAEQIKFKPAKLQNEPVDFPARVRIQFRLAY